jgi:hypothetical protein
MERLNRHSNLGKEDGPRVKVPPELVAGDVDEGYGKLADAFRCNMTSGKEIGAAVAVYRDGVKVVDLWGGYRNGITKAPWQDDTLVTMFSTTKGVASLAVAVAASRGLISYDAKVADYWPEFAQAGKDTITVRQQLSHQAGLPVVSPPLTLHDLTDPAKMSAKIAAQAPAWTPGTRHGYHVVTLGWYESETTPESGNEATGLCQLRLWSTSPGAPAATGMHTAGGTKAPDRSPGPAVADACHPIGNSHRRPSSRRSHPTTPGSTSWSTTQASVAWKAAPSRCSTHTTLRWRRWLTRRRASHLRCTSRSPSA